MIKGIKICKKQKHNKRNHYGIWVISISLRGSDSETQSVEVVGASPSTFPSTLPSRSLTVTGNAIDGYIAGGIVFLDINVNAIAESTEPQKVTEKVVIITLSYLRLMLNVYSIPL
jgi:hypothetical protein